MINNACKRWIMLLEHLLDWLGREVGERYLGGRVSIGPVTIYGYNGMHVAVDIRTPWGYLCLHPTWRVFGRWWPWHVYFSKDATPVKAMFYIGKRNG